MMAIITSIKLVLVEVRAINEDVFNLGLVSYNIAIKLWAFAHDMRENDIKTTTGF